MNDKSSVKLGDSARRVPTSDPLGSPGPCYRSPGPPVAHGTERERGEQSRRSVLRIEDATEVKVGEFYDVPWITVSERQCDHAAGQRIPVLGDVHEDKDIIGFDWDHFHVDWRFVRAKIWNRVRPYHEYRSAIPDHDGIALVKVVSLGYRGCRITDRGRFRVRCLRPIPVFPVRTVATEPKWRKDLEDAYAHASAKCGRCPHRGISLAGAPVENGARVCPGHGLSWHLETGELVRRAV